MILKVLGDKTSYKSSPNYLVTFGANLKTSHFNQKGCCYFFGNVGKFWLLFVQTPCHTAGTLKQKSFVELIPEGRCHRRR